MNKITFEGFCEQNKLCELINVRIKEGSISIDFIEVEKFLKNYFGDGLLCPIISLYPFIDAFLSSL